MDRLAAEGVNCRHAFTPIPVCVPARCSLLTGQFPTQHGVIWNYDGENFKRLDPGLPMSPRCVQQAGYYTAHVGHWHVDRERTPHDFGFHDYIPDWRYGQWRKTQGLQPCPTDGGWKGQADPYVTPQQTAPGWSAGEVIRTIQNTCRYGDPFFIRWHVVEPHPACRPPEPFASMYDPATIQPWPGFADEMAGKPLVQRQLRMSTGVDGMSWSDWQPIVARYLGVISLLDAQIGRVLDALDDMGLSQNTLVVYTSDHGDMCGSHGMFDKHCIMYDDVVRVPMIARWPGVIPAASVTDGFISNAVDIASTLVDAAGAEIPDSFAGESLLPLWRGETEGRPDIYASYHGNQFGAYSQRMLRDRRWKYVWNLTAEDELYDLQTDPAELQNRIYDRACAEALQRLRLRLIDWMEQVNDVLLNTANRRALTEGRIL